MRVKLNPVSSGGIILTYRCSATCAHCLYNCSPRANNVWFDLEHARNLFSSIVNISPTPPLFHLGGGEPFLNWERLCSHLRTALNVGVEIEFVETNAYWCHNVEYGLDKFTQLRDIGLKAILISYTPFHAEYVPLERIFAALKAAKKVFGASNALLFPSFYLSKISQIITSGTLPLKDYLHHYSAEELRHELSELFPLTASGRAIKYPVRKHLASYSLEQLMPCQCDHELFQSGHYHFDPFGHVIPFYCAGITLMKDTEMETTFRAGLTLQSHHFLYHLAKSGLAGLLDFARKICDYRPKHKQYAGKCHLCQEIREALFQSGYKDFLYNIPHSKRKSPSRMQ